MTICGMQTLKILEERQIIDLLEFKLCFLNIASQDKVIDGCWEFADRLLY